MSVLWRRIFTPRSYTSLLKSTGTELPHRCSLYTSVLPICNLKPVNNYYNILRNKSKKQQKEPDSDDEGGMNERGFLDNDDYTLSKDSKLIKFSTTSLRTDLILKSSLGIARNKVEQLFFESKIRINGKKLLKKSVPVKIDYEIDVIKSVSPKNPDHLYVARVVILNLQAKEESIAITARRFRNLLIENYEIDPYKPSTSEEDNI